MSRPIGILLSFAWGAIIGLSGAPPALALLWPAVWLIGGAR